MTLHPADWDPRWGDKADYGITDAQDLDGFRVGEEIRVIEDNDNEGYYVDDTGFVVGIAHIEQGSHPMSAPTRDRLVIHFDGMDPIEVPTEDVEAI